MTDEAESDERTEPAEAREGEAPGSVGDASEEPAETPEPEAREVEESGDAAQVVSPSSDVLDEEAIDAAQVEMAGEGAETPAEPVEGLEEEAEPTFPGEDDEEGPGLERSLHLPTERRKSVVESLIFVAEQPITERQIAQRLGLTTAEVRLLVEEIIADYELQDRGIRIDRISGGLLFRTAVTNAAFVRQMTAPKPVRMTRAQLETLSIVAYRQPVTRPEIDDIRGVDSGAALKVLADRDLIRILGRKEEPGRPLLYGTTTQFLSFFGLDSIRDLPTLREFSELSDESRALFERRMGEPLDLKSVAEEARAAEEAMQDQLLTEEADEEFDELPAMEDDDAQAPPEQTPVDPETSQEDLDDDEEDLDDDEEDLDDDEEDLDDDEPVAVAEPHPVAEPRPPLSDDFDDDDFEEKASDDGAFENPDFDDDSDLDEDDEDDDDDWDDEDDEDDDEDWEEDEDEE